MFEDEWRDTPTLFHIRLSWDRYVLCTALWAGWAIAVGSATFHYQSSPALLTSSLLPSTSLPTCSAAVSLSQWLLTVGCLHLLSLLLLTALRDRRGSLQVRATLIVKALQAALLLLSLLSALALTVVLSVSLSSYSTSTSSLCPSTPSSYLYVTSALTIPFSFLASLFSLFSLLSLVYQRLVFAHPPPKPLSSTQEADAITWIRARNGSIIPTLLIVPPTVDLSQSTPGQFPCPTCLLYSHGNAMDLEDSVFVLRALAETFDCGVLAYDFPGYGFCQGPVSEDGCNAAIEAAYRCLIEYHHATPQQIILYGRSLGTGPSVHLAHQLRSEMGGLVLQSPPLSVLRAGCPCITRTFPFDLFPTCDRIGALTLPVFILHGTKDGVVPFSHAVRLHELLSPASAFPPLWVEGGDHQRSMPKPWLYSTERSDADSDVRFAEKMRVNERNSAYIARMRQFLFHCRQRAVHPFGSSPRTPLIIDPSLPVLPIHVQKALLEQLTVTPAAVREGDEEEKTGDEWLVVSPGTVRQHAIFSLGRESKESKETVLPSQTPLHSSAFPSPFASPLPGYPSHRSAATAVSAPVSALASPRSMPPLVSPSANAFAGPPPFISLPSSLPLIGFHSPHPLPSLPLSDEDDSPPAHVRTQSAAAAVRAISRLTSYPHSRHAPRRSVTVNTVERVKAAGAGSGGVPMEALLLLDDAATREIRLVRDVGSGGTWRVERIGGEEEGGGTQTQGSSGEGGRVRRARRSLSESPPQPSKSLDSSPHPTIVIREGEGTERKEE